MKYYLIAGERSGDLHAANLMKALLKQDTEAQFRYFGGDYMQAVGGTLVVHYREMAFMGFWEVAKNISVIKKLLTQCQKDLRSFRPDIIILVDYAGFNLKIARYAKQNGFKVFYYISPKVWAWNPKRALKIKDRVDHMLAILPFEVEFYQKYDWPDVTYVGNPVIEAVKQHIVNRGFPEDHQLHNKDTLIAVLPGSRRQELKHILPTLKEVMVQLSQHHFCVAAVTSLPQQVYEPIANLANVTLVFDETYDLLAHAKVAVVTSGTATLETALWNVPQVVVYKASKASYTIAKTLVKVEFISLVNLIMGREVVKELIQQECTPANIINEIESLLKKGSDYTALRKTLGDQVASVEAARLITSQIYS